MSTYWCHNCGRSAGLVGNAETSNLTGNKYLVSKFVRHTLPGASSGSISVFNDPSFERYKSYVISSDASGAVERDQQGRVNVILYAGPGIGATWRNGLPVLDNDAVKLVLSANSAKIHAYSISSTGYSTTTCSVCSGPILS